MGKEQSKEEQNGDSQVTVIQNQAMHTSLHEAHELKLWMVLIISIMHLLLSLYKMHEKRLRKRALKTARSVLDLPKV